MIGLTKSVGKRIWQSIRWNYQRPIGADQFLKQVTGVVHVGANTGQERYEYDKHNLQVLWIEPISNIFSQLQDNLKAFPRQRAIQSLITDTDNSQCRFNISNNGGASSSLLELKDHQDIWPDVRYESSVVLNTITLGTLFEREQLNPAEYQALVMDTQGSELLVLRGSVRLLKSFRFIKTEVPDFESYAGCCKLTDIEDFLGSHGYKELTRQQFATHPKGGGYWDIVFERHE